MNTGKASDASQPAYTLILDRRARASLTGVTDVESFDEGMVVLRTHGGRLILTGSDLHVSALQLESGKLELDGMIDSAVYDMPAGKRGLFRRKTT